MRSYLLIFIFAFLFICTISNSTNAQTLKTKNVFIVTLDGLRWQELFEGADSAILFNRKYVKDESIASQFWHNSYQKRRERLMPFFWNVIGTQGQLYGSRNFGNKVDCSNPHWFSYPGYSEMLVGFVDRRINSNRGIQNPNYTILDFISTQPGFENKVSVFATWEVIANVVREGANDIHVNAGKHFAKGNISDNEKILNDLQPLTPNPHGARYDSFTYAYAFEYLKRERPRAMFISFDETDEHGHGGRYDEYLKSAHQTDKMLYELWKWIQSDNEYKDQTTLLITTDHGRGSGNNSWKNHGRLWFGSGEIWLAVIGPDTPSSGEMKSRSHYYQKQVASTLGAFLGLSYSNIKSVGSVIHSMISITNEQKQLVAIQNANYKD